MEYTDAVQDGLGEKLTLCIQFTSSFVCGIAFALYYCYPLALLLMCVVPIAALLLGATSGPLTKSYEQASTANNAAGITASEALSAIRTVHSLALTLYLAQLREAFNTGKAKFMALGITVSTVTAIMVLTYALGLWFVAFLILTDICLE